MGLTKTLSRWSYRKSELACNAEKEISSTKELHGSIDSREQHQLTATSNSN